MNAMTDFERGYETGALQRKALPWESMSDEEWHDLWIQFGCMPMSIWSELTHAIERGLREKNT